MTARELYYFNRRLQRVNRKYVPLSSSNMVAALKELYTIRLDEKDQVKYDLIRKYEDKVSKQLLLDRKLLREKGVKQGKDFMKELVYAKNPLMDMIKSAPWVGKSLAVPLKFGDTF